MDSQYSIIFILEIIGTIAFSVSGTLVGINQNMDLFGVCMLGVITAVGGGMTRDVILCKVPSALTNPIYIITALITSVIIFAILYLRKKHLHGISKIIYEKSMLIMDSIGLGVFTILGVIVGINAGYSENGVLLVFLGVLTGVGGGLLRDTLASVPAYIFVKHIYALASMIGAILYVEIYKILGENNALLISSLIIILIRLAAAHFRWNLPKIKISDANNDN